MSERPDAALIAAGYWDAPEDDPTDVPTCTFCGHPIENHGTTEVGCADCGCGHDPDWADE